MSVRLACVKHAASVHPEPGSNSLVKMFDQTSAIADFLSVLYFGFWSLSDLLKNFSLEFFRVGMHHLIVKVLTASS